MQINRSKLHHTSDATAIATLITGCTSSNGNSLDITALDITAPDITAPDITTLPTDNQELETSLDDEATDAMAVVPASDVNTSNGLISRSNLNTQLRQIIELLNATHINELKDEFLLPTDHQDLAT